MSDYQTDVVGADVALAASDMRESFSYDGYQIVVIKRRFLAQASSPAMISLNAANAAATLSYSAFAASQSD